MLVFESYRTLHVMQNAVCTLHIGVVAVERARCRNRRQSIAKLVQLLEQPGNRQPDLYHGETRGRWREYQRAAVFMRSADDFIYTLSSCFYAFSCCFYAFSSCSYPVVSACMRSGAECVECNCFKHSVAVLLHSLSDTQR